MENKLAIHVLSRAPTAVWYSLRVERLTEVRSWEIVQQDVTQDEALPMKVRLQEVEPGIGRLSYGRWIRG
jgi:hypothetical protein